MNHLNLAILIVFGTLGTSSCGGDPRTSTAPSATPAPVPSAATMVSGDTSVALSMFDTPRMSRSLDECTAMTGAFTRHFKLASGHDIGLVEQEILWTDVESLMTKVISTHRGIIFHYGLSEGKFRLALSPVTLAPTAAANVFSYATQPQVYPLVGNRIAQEAVAYNTWYKGFTSAPLPTTGTYFNQQTSINVRRTDQEPATYVPVQLKKDAEQEMMPYELEIQRLYDQNWQAGHSGYHTYLVVRCAAEFDSTEQSYLHKMCLHMRYRLKADITNFADSLSNRYSPVADPTPFRGRGADLGNLCPPNNNCGKYQLQRSLR